MAISAEVRSKIIWTIALAPVTAMISYFSRGVLKAWGVLDPYAEQFGRALRSTDTGLLLTFAAALIGIVLYIGALFFIWWRRRSAQSNEQPAAAPTTNPQAQPQNAVQAISNYDRKRQLTVLDELQRQLVHVHQLTRQGDELRQRWPEVLSPNQKSYLTDLSNLEESFRRSWTAFYELRASIDQDYTELAALFGANELMRAPEYVKQFRESLAKVRKPQKGVDYVHFLKPRVDQLEQEMRQVRNWIGPTKSKRDDLRKKIALSTQ